MKKIINTILLSLTAFPVLSNSYIGAKMGKSWLNYACSSNINCTDENSSVGLFLGYDFRDWISLEVDYTDLGNFNIKSLNKEKITQLSLSPTFYFDITPKIRIFSKLGLVSVSSKNIDDYRVHSAIGFDYLATKNSSIRLEYQRVNNINHPFTDLDSNVLMLGFKYSFPTHYLTKKTAPIKETNNENNITIIPDKKLEIIKKQKVYLISNIDFGKTTFDDKAENELNHVVSFLYSTPNSTVNIIGHTDSIGPESYNQTLSEMRAKAIVHYLINKNIPYHRIKDEGRGEREPIATNTTPEGRNKNRRVEIIIQ
ncbi:OmpA family protein [Vibrio cincinnatiensis]|uniref:OmpA family protein n=1 Tax=Vibrio cincinnatiensis TaxID=675 RepID=UPI001EDDB03C|nr:OmpA family protein [Vibrio cincinnatiensis]